MLLDVANHYDLLVTIEENVLAGGAGSAVNECLLAHNRSVEVLNLGVLDRHLDHGSQAQQLAECGLDPAGILNQVQRRLDAGAAGISPVKVVKFKTK